MPERSQADIWLIVFNYVNQKVVSMANPGDPQNRDLTLPPDSFIYMQNVGKGGIITVYRGPTVVNQTGQDQPVRYDSNSRTYKPCGLEQAVQNYLRANEGDYVVLENPAENNQFPSETTQQARPLNKGRKTVIPGPWSEALWPGQSAIVVEGHRLRTNQYLVAIVYNATEAKKNWDTGTVAEKQTEAHVEITDAGLSESKEHVERTEQQQTGLPKPDSFAVGTRIVIKGSDVSFFIPCTGIEVMKDENGKYVREAVTLEQLEYCCLIDESGKKEYPRGPKVVFPRPTQVFETDKKGRRKFRPIELNTINGIHLKVTAAFTGPDIENDLSRQRDFNEGEEIFITGKTLSIYYPREELSVIEYGQGTKKHFSTAIPKGEGRYIISRQTGEITLMRGPKMFLADPRIDLPVRRVLSVDEVSLWYPGNKEAIQYNLELAQAMANSPSGRSGVVSEGDWRKMQAKSLVASASSEDYSPEDVGDEGGATGSITRGTTFTAPRTLTLNTKYDGVPRIEVWSGYAILLVGAEGSRQVVQGPQVCLLEYDQKLGFMELSTGKPKNSDKLYKTAYMKVQNNQVGDIVSFESRDQVKGTIKISLRVNFESETEEDKLKWFSVDNYVKYLTDHVRSMIAGTTKKKTVAEIKSDYVNIVRDCLLGPKPENGDPRVGLYFEDNGMRVVEVEVLDINLSDISIANLLNATQHQVVQSNIELEQAERELEITRRKEQVAQDTLRIQYETKQLQAKIKREALADEIELLVSQTAVALKQIEGDAEKTEATDKILEFKAAKALERAKAETDHKYSVDTAALQLRKEELVSTTDAAVKRFEAAKNGLHEVLISLGRDEMAAKLAQGCTIERYLSGDSVGSSISNLLSVAPVLKNFFDRAEAIQTKDPNNRLAAAAGNR